MFFETLQNTQFSTKVWVRLKECAALCAPDPVIAARLSTCENVPSLLNSLKGCKQLKKKKKSVAVSKASRNDSTPIILECWLSRRWCLFLPLQEENKWCRGFRSETKDNKLQERRPKNKRRLEDLFGLEKATRRRIFLILTCLVAWIYMKDNKEKTCQLLLLFVVCHFFFYIFWWDLML